MGKSALQKRKKTLQGSKMSDAYMAEARSWANELVEKESKHGGDIEGAMRRLETRCGVSWRTFWSLRYRPPKDILLGTYLGLRAAYEAECERQIKRLQHELEITKAAGIGGPAVDQAKALVFSGEGE